MRRIGIRASTVRTRQGAGIIIPNAQLVTEKVTNWTLGDQLRRIDLDVGVNYGAVPKKVIGVLELVALGHPQVLRNPKPRGLFVGFGDSSISFELRAWMDQFADWSHIRIELTVALYDAMQEAGMSFLFPQREVRLLVHPVNAYLWMEVVQFDFEIPQPTQRWVGLHAHDEQGWTEVFGGK